MRIAGDEIAVTPEQEPPLWVPAPEPVCVPGGLGDRKLVDRVSGSRLVVDADGAVLEASWANVWLVEGDTLITPPADGRILPGITRARVLGGLLGRRAVVEPFDLDRYERADAVLLTSAIRIVTGVGEASAELVAGLRAAATAPSPSA
jgi:para-aminobenzoate synthetase/4-amino-4-deoxychorismate lyase